MRSGTLLAVTGIGLVAASLAGIAVASRGGNRPARAARYAAWGSALLAGSVLADSAMEHYRGNFRRKEMFAAPVVAAGTLATALATAVTSRATSYKAALFGGTIATGLFGLGFHLRNILSRPGGLSWNNLFYRAPFGAPGALALAGLAGVGAVAADRADRRERLGQKGHGRRAGYGLGLFTAAGLFGLTAEVGLLHFRGAFHDKLMYAPILALPFTGAAIMAATADPQPRRRSLARKSLEATAGLGLVGTGLHAYGVSRNMGGFANWTQNLFQGPPIAAPPSLAGLALMGFAALDLLDRHGKDPSHGPR
ncbi:hypothetical protein [Jiella sonneratiae]|uniref:Uncharacterized protein n=1 Tax=Jiella sonneratiae TaxID=2816856 RepID=A0ABS3IXU3_9HYPH|nr:hypothetical protein [Jiella sonneratiae]MBO0902225.1 hypothetical protein [Jiella sonneratiae]